MGQYYRGAILAKDYKENEEPVLFSASPYTYGNGAKLLEHSYVRNRYVNVFMKMLSDTDGLYFNHPFVWVGDYSDAVGNKFYDIYDYAYKVEKTHTEKENEVLSKDDVDYKYIINFTKNEYVKIDNNKDEDYVMHPLPLLTAYGNGRGGGDYYMDEGLQDIGRWAFDYIGVTNDESLLEGKTEFKTSFVKIL